MVELYDDLTKAVETRLRQVLRGGGGLNMPDWIDAIAATTADFIVEGTLDQPAERPKLTDYAVRQLRSAVAERAAKAAEYT
jgi:hypothetical protein